MSISRTEKGKKHALKKKKSSGLRDQRPRLYL